MQINNLPSTKAKQIKVLYLATLVLFLPMIAAVSFLYIQDESQDVKIIEPEKVERLTIDLNQVRTDAYSAIVVSLNTGDILYEKNADKPLPLASLTKLITAKVADDTIDKNTVIIDKMSDFTQYGDARLIKNQIWKKDELIGYMLVTSSNDGAHTLAQNSKYKNTFINNMNGLAATVGLVDTHFYNETGLDDDIHGVIASKGTASDVSKILAYLIKTDLPLYEKTQHNIIDVSTPNGFEKATNTNETADIIPGLLVSKTGYTDLAGGNLAVVADMGLNEPTAFIVLKSSRDSRFEDVHKLQEAYFAEVRERMK